MIFDLADEVSTGDGATGAQASSLAITRRRDNAATGTVALQSDPVATASGTDVMFKRREKL